MIFSISNIAWLPSNRIQAYSLLQKNKFTGIEIAPGLLFNNSENSINPSNEEIKKIKDELRSFNLELVSMQSLLYNREEAKLFGDYKQRELFLNEITNVINLAERLEIPNLVLGSPKNRIIPKKVVYSEAEDIALSTFIKLGDLASISGTCISIEPNPKEYGTNFINNTNEAIDFIKKIDSKGIRAILDIGSLKMNGEYDNLDKIIDNIKDYLNHVHLSEPYLEPAPKSSLDFQHLYNSLKRVKYNKAISIEMKYNGCYLDTVKKSLSMMSKVGKS